MLKNTDLVWKQLNEMLNSNQKEVIGELRINYHKVSGTEFATTFDIAYFYSLLNVLFFYKT